MQIRKATIERENFSKIKRIIDLPDLIEIQKKSYSDFLQSGKEPSARIIMGLEEVFREIFPISDFNETSILEYLSYKIEPPKYTPRESMDRNTNYASPLKVKVRLVNYDVSDETDEKIASSAIESEVYLCDIPLLTERGTFVINGVERVIVSQLHRSPGIFFEDMTASKSIIEKHLYSGRIIPYRGSWIDFEFDTKNIMYVRIDKKKKILATVLLKALGLTSQDILDTYYEKEKVIIEKGRYHKIFNIDTAYGQKISLDIVNDKGEVIIKANNAVTKAGKRKLEKSGIKRFEVADLDLYESYLANDIIDSNGEVLAEANTQLSESVLEIINENSVKEFEILFIDKQTSDTSIRDILAIDKVKTREEALIDIYKKLRPGEPATNEQALLQFNNLFFNHKRYDLSRVGRLKINKRLGVDTPSDVITLTKEDIVETIRVLEQIRLGIEKIDDIDHLGHRRVRAAGEQLQNHIRVGLARMEKTVKERMSIQDMQETTPQDLLNAKPLSASIKEFFGSYQLSQFMDQNNPLSEITHKRRLSALGPGGLNRDRAGFDVRDVHTSHYGRICPIETPEGPNIGLITSLTTYAKINEFGFIETPYRKVIDGKVSNEIVYMYALEEEDYFIAQANTTLSEDGSFVSKLVECRHASETLIEEATKMDYMDVSPMQIVSVSTALIPFLEHDDANRALMGSNMQRQAVPLIRTDAPIVGTGLERKVALDSGSALIAKNAGVVDYVDAEGVIVRYIKKDGSFGIDVYELVKYKRSNQDTCINYNAIVTVGQKVKAGDTLADGAATDRGELALGRNTVVAFMPWMGYNYEDSILVSEKLVKEDVFTSIHIEVFDIDARDTKLGAEEITAELPNVSTEATSHLDESGIITVGTKVADGDILVGKVTPKGETQASPEEKLLRAIFQEKAGDVKDASLRVPSGISGTVLDVQVMTRRDVQKDARTESIEKDELKKIETDHRRELKALENARVDIMKKLFTGKKVIKDSDDIKSGTVLSEESMKGLNFVSLSRLNVEGKDAIDLEIQKINELYFTRIGESEDKLKDRHRKIGKGDELPAGVLKSVRVFVAIRRKLSVGDKMAGRHGNKGVVSRILPEEDMPYLPDGTPVELILNPLSVPSRMNVGQILETHLGWAARGMNKYVATEVFNGAKEADIKSMLVEAGYQSDGQTKLYDGRSGDMFEQEVTVGIMYMLKLHHLVDTKIHARSTGPYSLVTQQPLGGKAQFGGQRLGEMEVWALEAYGAANVLQEMLTVKSDDVEGRTAVYESIVNGNFTFTPSMPESFNVLIKELQGLVLDIDLLTADDLLAEQDSLGSDENEK